MANPAASTAAAGPPAKALATEGLRTKAPAMAGRGAGTAEGGAAPPAKAPADLHDRISAMAGLPGKAPAEADLSAKAMAAAEAGIRDRTGTGVDALRAMTSSTRAIPR